MITTESIGKRVQYWSEKTGSGWHVGLLKAIQGTTAVIQHPIAKKRDLKVHVSECKPYEGESMPDTIFDQLFRVAQTKGVGKQLPGESDQDYLKKVLKAVNSVDEATWNTIPIPAQQWFNEAARAVSSMNQIPSCPGFIGKDAVEKTIETSTPPKGLTAKEALETQTPVKVKPSLPNSPAKRKREVTGVMDALRRTVIIHPDWTTRQVYDYLRLNGFPNVKIDTVSVDGGNIKRVIEIARSLGLWNDTPQRTDEEPVQAEETKQAS